MGCLGRENLEKERISLPCLSRYYTVYLGWGGLADTGAGWQEKKTVTRGDDLRELARGTVSGDQQSLSRVTVAENVFLITSRLMSFNNETHGWAGGKKPGGGTKEGRYRESTTGRVINIRLRRYAPSLRVEKRVKSTHQGGTRAPLSREKGKHGLFFGESEGPGSGAEVMRQELWTVIARRPF